MEINKPPTPSPPCQKAACPVDMDAKLSSEKQARSSFSSVRENDAALVQTFTSTKVSSYAAPEAKEQAIVDDRPTANGIATAHNGNQDDDYQQRMATATQTQFTPPLTQPGSRLHGSWLPAVAADSFQGWKQIGVKGRQASRSYGDLRSLRLTWSTPEPPVEKTQSPKRGTPGEAAIERLPSEVLGAIVDLLVLDVPPNGLTARNIDLRSLLLTSRALHGAALNSLYKNITIPHSRIFRKFLGHVSQNPELGTIVRRIDFSHFNPTTLFTTASERATTRNLTPETLRQCLELTPYLREFLAQEYVDEEIDIDVLRKLLFGLPRLNALDLCACSSAKFKQAWQTLTEPSESSSWPDGSLPITRLSLHRCSNLGIAVFEKLMPRLANVTHLDVAGTNITDEALHSIPHAARITHLNLAKCKRLSADSVAEFLAHHPAVSDSLVFLSLSTDARSHQLLATEDVSRVLPLISPSVRSLSLKGSRMDPSHIDLLRPMTEHLEELAMGRGLDIATIARMFTSDTADSNQNPPQESEAPPRAQALKYLDLSDYAASELDLNELYKRLLTSRNHNLDVIEVPESLYTRLERSSPVQRAGWAVLDFGSRAWLVRRYIPKVTSGGVSMMSPVTDAEAMIPRDNGSRSWKMGASYWGMRKIPVAAMEVGGMYGMYMFKRTL